MGILIENYRGWEIKFDTQNEEFNCISNEYDKYEKKKSFSSAKKYVDDYIKENQKFKPIKVMSFSRYSEGDFITLIGLRKDGAFMAERENGEKFQLSKYSEDAYFLVDEKNNGVFAEISNLSKKRDSIEGEIAELEKKIIKTTVKEARTNLET